MPHSPESIYSPEFVRQLFNKMSASYERMNTITSFGFSNRWRRQCVYELDIQPGQTVVDLMTGMGETWEYICQRIGPEGTLLGVDFCENMLRYATKKQNQKRFLPYTIEIRQEDVLALKTPAQLADHVVIAFGLKTFNEAQISELANAILHILKPGGQFSCIEVSVPKPSLLRLLYLFYLKRIIPVLGALFLGNPQTYKMLGVYTAQFGSSDRVSHLFTQAGLNCHSKLYFFGCATGVVGSAPLDNLS